MKSKMHTRKDWKLRSADIESDTLLLAPPPLGSLAHRRRAPCLLPPVFVQTKLPPPPKKKSSMAATRDDAELKRASGRQRQLSEKVRVFDEDTRQELKRQRLRALEQDNWREDAGDGEDTDDDYIPDDNSEGEGLFIGERKASKKKEKKVAVPRAKKKKTRHGGDAFRDKGLGACTFDDVVAEAQYDKLPPWVPTYVTAAARPSSRPPRHFCYLTGLPGKYKCPVTGDYLANLDAYEMHTETRLKGLV